jgi:hypothetical protein
MTLVRTLTLSLALVLLGLSSAAQAAGGLFDAPIKLVRLPLPADPANPQAKAQLSCFYFPRFAVKEVDLGELGAEQLSIIPVAQGAKRPVCKRDNIDSEIVIPGDEWSGYFWGVKGGYVFFSAEDGWNGGMGFAVFDMNAKKLFEDAAKTWHSIQAVGPGATLRYQRVYEAPCSLKGEDGAGCWQQIQKDTGLASASEPDCSATYAAEQRRTPTLAQQVLTDPTVFDYEVTVALGPPGHTIKPAGDKVLACRPAE